MSGVDAGNVLGSRAIKEVRGQTCATEEFKIVTSMPKE